MPDARLNFEDHIDGSFSMQAKYQSLDGQYAKYSPSHQLVRIIYQYVHESYQPAMSDEAMDLMGGQDFDIETVERGAVMFFSDKGDGQFAMTVKFWPHGASQDSPSHLACRFAWLHCDYLCRALRDGTVDIAGSDRPVIIPRAKQNAQFGHTE